MRLIAGFAFGIAIAAAVIGSSGLVVTSSGCKSPILGPVVDVAACIVKDAVSGAPVAQIVTDCGADLATGVMTLLRSTDASAQKSTAFAEARALRASLVPLATCEGTVIPFDGGTYDAGGK